MGMLTSTTDDLVARLSRVDGRAEIVDEKIVQMSPTGDLPSSAGLAIAASLREHARKIGGRAYPDNVAYLIDLPNRSSLSPDASYYTGPRSKMKFLPQAPDFAAEVRSENDYGPQAEEAMAAKRADYFAAGTKVVWDVDLLAKEAVVRVFRGNATEPVAGFSRGQLASAEPAVPGWTMRVDELFE